MRFSQVVFLLISVLILSSFLFSQHEPTPQVSAAEMTLEPSGEGIDSFAILTQRMIDRRNLSTTGNASILPDTQFWIWLANVRVWKNFVDVHFSLGKFLFTMSLVPPYEYCRDFKVYIHWWNDTIYGFNTWSYPTGSCG
jgi:hypothetical protein